MEVITTNTNEGHHMTITELVEQSWRLAERKGFHDDIGDLRTAALVRLCLIHTEVSEAAQEVKRHGVANAAAIGDELADVLIRAADLAGILGIDLQACVVAKMARNANRPHKFGTPDEVRNHE